MADRQLSDIVHRAAQAEPASWDPEQRTLDVTWTTGATVSRFGYDPDTKRYGEYDEELVVSPDSVDTARLDTGAAPVLDAHDSYSLRSVIGRVESYKIGKGEATARLRFTGADDAAPIIQRIADGTVRNVSVGYRVLNTERITEGRTKPLVRVTRWAPAEISMVPIGADHGATARAYVVRGLCPDIPLPEAPEMTTEREAPAAPETQTMDAATAIKQLARALGVDLNAPAGAQTADEAVRAAYTEAQQAQAPAPIAHAARAEVGIEDWQKRSQQVVAALTVRAHSYGGGIGTLDAHLVEQARGLAHLTAAQICGHLVRGEGIDPSMMAPRDVVRAAFRWRHGSPAAGDRAWAARSIGGGHSTSDFDSLLADVMHNLLLPAYASEPAQYQRWARRKMVDDFRTHYETRVGQGGSPSLVPEGGEIVYATVSDGQESMRAYRFAVGYLFTDELIVNDKLGGVAQFMGSQGQVFARFRNSYCVGANGLYGASGLGPTMSDSTALFTTGHRNYVSSGAAPSTSEIGDIRTTLRTQQDDDGNSARHALSLLMFPAILETAVEQLFSERWLPTAASTAVPQGIRSLDYIIEPDLDTAGETTGYYGFDVARTPARYLEMDGQATPAVETFRESDSFGVKFRLSDVFGFGFADWLGICKNKGAA